MKQESNLEPSCITINGKDKQEILRIENNGDVLYLGRKIDVDKDIAGAFAHVISELCGYTPQGFIAHRISQVESQILQRCIEELKEYPNKYIELYGGKLPFVMFEGQMDEEEKISMWKLGFVEALKVITNLQNER